GIYQVFPIIIVSEKALQVSTMNILFRDRFMEMLQEIDITGLTIQPLCIIHVSDLETIQDTLHDKYYLIWDLIRTNADIAGFPTAFSHTLIHKNIRPKHKRVLELYQELIPKFQK